jgi:hypothetical protein
MKRELVAYQIQENSRVSNLSTDELFVRLSTSGK